MPTSQPVRLFGSRIIAAVLLVLLITGIGVTSPAGLATLSSASAATGDGTVTVRVVHEVNANGIVDSTMIEPPLAGITVRLSDASGQFIEAATDSSGRVVFEPAASSLQGGSYRIEAENPRPDFFYPAHVAHDQNEAAGPVTTSDLQSPSNMKISAPVEFIDVSGGISVNVNMGFWYPPYYCQENPALCGAHQPWSSSPGPVSAPGEKTLLSLPYRMDGDDQPLATNEQTGAVYGIAYDRKNERIFSAAYAARGSTYGPGGPGAIYVTDLNTVTYPLTGTTSQFTNVPNAGVDNHDFATHDDYAFFDHVGKESLGDIDVTNDDRYLFGVNMYDKTVFVYDLLTDAYRGSYQIPNPGCGEDWRPMGTGVGLDTNYVGGVCSGQTNQDMEELSAHVFQFDAATGLFGAEVVNEPLTYGRGIVYRSAYCSGAIDGGDVGRWFSWIDGYPSGPNEQRAQGCQDHNWIGYPTPMLGDIIEDTNGDLIIAFRDRFADQAAYYVSNELVDGEIARLGEPASGGDILRGCQLTDGTFVLDPNLTSIHTLIPSAICADNNNEEANTLFQSDAFREFYSGDWRTGYNEEAFYAGIALARNETTLTGSAINANSQVWTQGIASIHRSGEYVSEQHGVRTDDQTSDMWGESAAMGGLAVVCVSAPTQIGNRVWVDSNRNGIQDAAESFLAGVTVRLYDESGSLLATTITTDTGHYTFDDSTVPGGLTTNSYFTVRLDEASDYDSGGALSGLVPTVLRAGDNDLLNSGGSTATDGFVRLELSTSGAGENDQTTGFGFTSPEVEIAGAVWLDDDGDGIQDPDEDGLAGIELTLTDGEGQPVLQANNQPVPPVRTQHDGTFRFTGVPTLEANAIYLVSISDTDSQTQQVLTGFILTTSSRTVFVTGLTEDGASAEDVNFGFLEVRAPDPTPEPTTDPAQTPEPTTAPPPTAPGGNDVTAGDAADDATDLPTTGTNLVVALQIAAVLCAVGVAFSVIAYRRRFN